MKRGILDSITRLGIILVLVLVSFTLFYIFVLKDMFRDQGLKSCFEKAKREFKSEAKGLSDKIAKGSMSSKDIEMITEEMTNNYERKCNFCIKIYSKK